jgi:hypothetical protein
MDGLGSGVSSKKKADAKNRANLVFSWRTIRSNDSNQIAYVHGPVNTPLFSQQVLIGGPTQIFENSHEVQQPAEAIAAHTLLQTAITDHCLSLTEGSFNSNVYLDPHMGGGTSDQNHAIPLVTGELAGNFPHSLQIDEHDSLVEPVGQTLPITTHHDEIDGNREPSQYKCRVLGCRSKATFKRRYEYTRHMKKHTSYRISCPIVYCPRQGNRAFYRWDKLSSHLQAGHTEDELCRCLVDGCNVTNMPLNVLRLHTRYHLITVASYPELSASEGFQKALRTDYTLRKCDLKKCKKSFQETKSNAIQAHLLEHPLNERILQGDIIQKMGYDPATARIICPLCQDQYVDSSQFLIHLEAAHLMSDPHHWTSIKEQIPTIYLNQNTWQIWWGIPNIFNVSCNYCGDAISKSASSNINHHLDLLNMSDEIKAARGAILRLVPRFSVHPIFEADKPTVYSYSSYGLP